MADAVTPVPLEFPNIGNALMQGAHARYYMGRAQQERDAAAGEQAARPDIAAAVGGDPAAQGRVASASPTTFAHLAPRIAQLDADKRAQLKATSEAVAHASNTLLQTDPKDRATVYPQMVEFLRSQGHDVSKLPAEYTPAFEGQARMFRGQSQDLLKILQQQEQEAGRNARHNTPGGGTPPAMEPMNGPTIPPAVPAAGPRADAGSPSVAPVTVAQGAPPALPSTLPASPIQKVNIQPIPNATGVATPTPIPNAIPGEAVATPAQIVQGDSPYPTPRAVTGPQVATPPGTQAAPAVPPQQGAIWSVDPSTQGGQMMGHRAKPGAPLLPAEIAGHFVYKLPNGQTVLFKPRAETPPDRVQPAPGFRWSPGQEGQRQEFIPGGNADPEILTRTAESKRIAAEKAIPQSITKGMQENLDGVKQIDRALGALTASPKGVGNYSDYVQRISPEWGGDLNNKVLNPEGAQVRALIADIGSLKLHDRSGAAVTASETPRLIPFIPKITDDAATIRTKLGNFRAVYEQTLRDTADYYGAENGFRPYTPATKYLEGGVGPEKAAPTAQGKPGERPPLESFQK